MEVNWFHVVEYYIDGMVVPCCTVLHLRWGGSLLYSVKLEVGWFLLYSVALEVGWLVVDQYYIECAVILGRIMLYLN